MIFEKESFAFEILDVLELRQENVNLFNTGRNFDALSYRFRDGTLLRTGAQSCAPSANSLCFVPARLDYTRTSPLDELIVVHFHAVNYVTSRIETFTPDDPAPFVSRFRQILALWQQKEPGYRFRCSALLYEIFAECRAGSAAEEAKSSKIRASVEYLKEQYLNPELTVGEIAARSFVSEVYFRKLFREEYGTSPQKYVIKLRIHHAVGLIATGYYSLQEVAFLSGYTDYKYFAVEFKRIMGVSPSAYRYNYNGT